MESSETDRIKQINTDNNQNNDQQQNIPIAQNIQNQQGIPIQQNAILYPMPMESLPQQQFIQNPTYIYVQPVPQQMIVVPVNQNQQIQPNQPIQQNNVINNQQKPKPKSKSKKEKKKSSTLQESTCPYCKKRIETELKNRCNFCTALYYFFMTFFICCICIFSKCDLSACNQDCCCCCNGCNCCCDQIRKCPNYGEIIYRFDSCEDKCSRLNLC